jgi:hypothetical protein
LTAFHDGDLAFARVHSDDATTGGAGGRTLTVHTDLPECGRCQLFIGFMTAGTLRTAGITTVVA